MEKSDQKLDRAMRDSLKQYATGNKKFFDYLQHNVRVYTLDSSSPIVGRDAFRSYFGSTFAKIKRRVSVVASDVQRADNRAILAQTLEIAAHGVSSFVRQTVIWEQDDGEWKMSHIHNALVGQPVSTGRAPRTAAAVRVLNERIATASATVGVAQ